MIRLKGDLEQPLTAHRFCESFFYTLLDLLLLRAWHVNRELRSLKKRSFSGKIKVLDAGSGFGQYSFRMSRIFAVQL